jgi:hypothetical protein
MKNMLGCALALIALLSSNFSFSQDSIYSKKNEQDNYLAKKKTAKGMIIGGSVSMGVGIVALGVSAAVATAEAIPVAFGAEPQNMEEAETGAVIGTVLFFGGTGVLIAGLITNGKANKMLNGNMTIRNDIIPVNIGNSQLAQPAISLQWKLPSRYSRR